MFGPITFPPDPDDDDRITWPSPGTADLEIVEDCEPLFTSCSWIIKAKVNNAVVYESGPSDHPFDRAYIKQWARSVIRKHQLTLRQKGVDVEAIYVSFGGILKDLR